MLPGTIVPRSDFPTADSAQLNEAFVRWQVQSHPSWQKQTQRSRSQRVFSSKNLEFGITVARSFLFGN